MTDTKTFSLGAVISVVDGRLVAPIGQIHELLDWMTGDTLFTHQLPRASEEAQPHLLEQFPDLRDVHVPDGIESWEDVEAFLNPLHAQLGSHLAVKPLDGEAHTSIDPISELRMMRPDMPIVVIAPEERHK